MAADEKKEIWFPAKRYGWGWGLPNCRQGWLAMATWMLLVITGSLVILCTLPFIFVYIYLFIMIVVFFALCWIKGDQPRWRWGEED